MLYATAVRERSFQRRFERLGGMRWAQVATAFALVLAALVWVVSWAVAAPAGSTPNEGEVLANIWRHTPQGGAGQRLDAASGQVEYLVPESIVSSPCFANDPTISGLCTMELPTDSVWWSPDAQILSGSEFYYFMLSGFFAANPSPTAVFWSVVAMRIYNGVLAIALIASVTALLARSGRRLLAYSLIPIASPMLIFLVASISPSSWAITGLIIAWFGTYAAFRLIDERPARYAASALAVLGGLLATFARADSAAYLAVSALLLVLLNWKFGRNDLWRFTLPALLFVIGIAGLVVGWRHINLVSGWASGSAPDTVFSSQIGLLFGNMLQFPNYLLRFPTTWLNWTDTEIPALTVVFVSVAWVALLLWGWGKSKPNWQKWFATLAMLFFIAIVPLAVLQLNQLLIGYGVPQQYFLPLLPILLAVVLWRPHRDGAPRLSRGYTWLLYLAIVAAHAAALHTQIRRFVRGFDNFFTRFYTSPRLELHLEWWLVPIPPTIVWLLGSLAFAVVATSLFFVRHGHANSRPNQLVEPGQLVDIAIPISSSEISEPASVE